MNSIVFKNEDKKALFPIASALAINEILGGTSAGVFRLAEINFKSPSQGVLTYAFTPESAELSHVDIIKAAIESYNAALTANTPYAEIAPQSMTIVQADYPEITTTTPTLRVQVNKASKKAETVELTVAYKAAGAAAPKAVATTAAVAVKKVEQKKEESKLTTTTTPQQQQHQPPSISLKERLTNDTVDHVMAALFGGKQQIDFAAVQRIYIAQREIQQLEAKLESATKEKERVVINKSIEEAKQAINQQDLVQFVALEKKMKTVVYEDVVTTSNMAYSQGIASVAQHPANKNKK